MACCERLCNCTSKTLLGLLGLIFALCAVCIWFISGYVIVTYKHYDKFLLSNFTLVPAICLIAVGVIFFFASILGCCGMCKQNRCILCMFGGFLILLLAMLVTAAVLTVVYKDLIVSSLKNQTLATLDKYTGNNESEWDLQINYVQQQLHCCGEGNYSDWKNTHWGMNETNIGNVPWSCCNQDDGCGGDIDVSEHEDWIYEVGCYKELLDLVYQNIGYIGGAALGFCILLLVGIISTCVLCCVKRTEAMPYFSLN